MEKKYKLTFRSSVSSSEFGKLLKNLGKKTYENFNTFGTINSSTLVSIIRHELSRKDKLRFFAFVNDDLISYSFLTKFEKKSKNHNCVLGIVIDDKWQNKSFGKEICKHMIQSAWKKNYQKIWLTVFFDNNRALKMYKNLGFQIEGIFMNDEKVNGKYRHVISMALFKNDKKILSNRKNILNKL